MTIAPGLDPDAAVAADAAFFEALLAADVTTLDSLLTEDFLIVDVMSGQVTVRADLLAAIGSRVIRFIEVERIAEDRTVRQHGGTAVVVGRTRMVIGVGDELVTAKSRYTHVFVELDGEWRMLSAQGTPTEG